MLIILTMSFCASMASLLHPVLSSIVQPTETSTNVTLYPATNITYNSAILTWTPYNDSDFASYQVRRTSTPGDYGCACTIVAIITSPNETSAVVDGMVENSTYYFIVRTYISGSNFDSNEINITTLFNTPTITIISPKNVTYGSDSVKIEWETSQPTAWMGYSLDYAQTVDLTESIMLNNMSLGTHVLTLYANNSQGNMGNATIFFTVSNGATPPTINHKPLSKANEGSQITLTAEIMDDTGVTDAEVFYRISGESNFTQLTMLKCPVCIDTYNATFTAPTGNDTVIEYYIYASDGTSNATSPSGAPAVLYNIAINSHPSAVQIIPPINATKHSALLTWTPSTVGDFQQYSIYISRNFSQGSIIANITSQQTTSYLTGGLLANTTYYFSVRVYDTGGLFQDSSQVAATTLIDNPTNGQSWLSQYGLYIAIVAIAVAVVAIAAIAIMHRIK